MRRDDESIAPFRETHGQLIADPVGILRCDLAGFEGLPDLVSDHISPLLPAGDLLIFPFGQRELFINGHRIAFVGCDQISLFRLLRILRIIGSCFTRMAASSMLEIHSRSNGFLQ